ncbi:MAG: lysophospholipid acyltransferase family protein [Planctomycetes bacterium]|nr:lysophospholipid acyltransferase family protein [Planctomycetota bacterium]
MDPRAERQARRALVAQRAAEREAQGRNTTMLVRFRRIRRRLGALLLETLAPWLVRALAATWRVERIDLGGQRCFDGDGPWIVLMWHGRMLPAMPLRPHRARRIGVLVSPSDDGGLAMRALRHFGYVVVRGSLSRRGARALREMHELLAGGGKLVVTPDGPRGPRHSCNVGPAWLARETGAPLLLLGLAADRVWRLKSWDAFVIPKPFARVAAVYSGPIEVPADADDATLERLSAEAREALLAAERAGFEALRVTPDHGDDHKTEHGPNVP